MKKLILVLMIVASMFLACSSWAVETLEAFNINNETNTTFGLYETTICIPLDLLNWQEVNVAANVPTYIDKIGGNSNKFFDNFSLCIQQGAWNGTFFLINYDDGTWIPFHLFSSGGRHYCDIDRESYFDKFGPLVDHEGYEYCEINGITVTLTPEKDDRYGWLESANIDIKNGYISPKELTQ